MSELTGKTIGHYKILELIGQGGMGIVYKAHDTELDRMIALKFLPQYLTSDAMEKDRFYHEARAASALNHPNVTTIFEIKEFETRLYLAMEFVEGRTLKRLVEQESLSVKKVLDIAIQVCEGLAAAHEKGVVHRDIKSDNIMITPRGQVKIMDFGLAKVKGSTKLTKAGSTIGTAAYMSPEQAQGEEIDHRSDIFSFGVVLYELLTTKLPFRGEHQAALMYSLINEDPQPLARFNEKVTPELDRIVAKALAKEKDERYQHVDDLLADLRRERKGLEYARAGYVTTQSIPVQPKPAARPVSWRKKALIPAGIVAVLGVLFMLFNPWDLRISRQQGTPASGKSSLAVMYFENIPDPEDKDHTGEMLTNLLTTSLFQTKDVEVISRERLYDIQKELGLADTKSIPPSVATKIAQRAGVSIMLIGTILQSQPSLAITYRLVEVQSGKILSTQRLSGYAPDKIFSLVDTLALLAKLDLHIAPTGPSEEKSVASVTTSSPEAYRSYLEGIALNNRFYASEARAAFRRAIELDSNFAMAYYSSALVNLGGLTAEEFQNAMRKAYALKEKVTDRERSLIVAAYAASVERDIPKAVADMELFVAKYPREQNAYAALGTLYDLLAQYEKKVNIYLQGLQYDSLDKNGWNSLAYTYAGLGRRREALDAADRSLQLAPAEANPYDSKGDMYAIFGEYDSATIWWQKALSFRPDFPSVEKLFWHAFVQRDVAGIERYQRQYTASKHEEEGRYSRFILMATLIQQGRLREAQTRYLEFLTSDQTLKVRSPVISDLRFLVTIDYELGDYAAMTRHAQTLSNELKNDPDEVYRGQTQLALAYFKSGNSTMASRLMEEVQGAVAREVPAIRARQYDYAMAILSFEQEEYDRALGQFGIALRSVLPLHAPLYHYSVCLLKAGRRQEAIAEFRRLAKAFPLGFSPIDLDGLLFSDYDLLAHVKAHYWLGVACEQQGEKKEAVKEYETFLDIWKSADFPSPELKDARERLSKLKGMSTR